MYIPLCLERPKPEAPAAWLEDVLNSAKSTGPAILAGSALTLALALAVALAVERGFEVSLGIVYGVDAAMVLPLKILK